MNVPRAMKNKPVEYLNRQPDGSWTATYGDFTLKTAFQPIFRFSNGKLRPVAFEGLLRPFADDVPVLTAAFFTSIPAADIGLIETLARTLHVRNAAKLHESAQRLFINFDPAALASKSNFEAILDDLGVELRGSDLMPSHCVCEITENAATSDEDLSYFVYALRARGYLIAVDDFGAASSDMTRIRALTPDIVKLDGPMVKRLMESPEGFQQLKALLAQFQTLRINTILEGLEELWQIEMAENAGADLVQGFAAAVPRTMPHNFDEWFTNDEKRKVQLMPGRPASA